MTSSQERKRINRPTADQDYVALGSRPMMMLLKLAGMRNVKVTETRISFQKELSKHPTDKIIITTTRWKQEMEMLENYPFTITLPDTPANISDTTDINILKKQVLGIEIGGS